MRALSIEYAVLGVIVAVFASVVGIILGAWVASGWLELPVEPVSWVSAAGVAFGIAARCLGAGGVWVARSLKASPATLLREIG